MIMLVDTIDGNDTSFVEGFRCLVAHAILGDTVGTEQITRVSYTELPTPFEPEFCPTAIQDDGGGNLVPTTPPSFSAPSSASPTSEVPISTEDSGQAPGGGLRGGSTLSTATQDLGNLVPCTRRYVEAYIIAPTPYVRIILEQLVLEGLAKYRTIWEASAPVELRESTLDITFVPSMDESGLEPVISQEACAARVQAIAVSLPPSNSPTEHPTTGPSKKPTQPGSGNVALDPATTAMAAVLLVLALLSCLCAGFLYRRYKMRKEDDEEKRRSATTEFIARGLRSTFRGSHTSRHGEGGPLDISKIGHLDEHGDAYHPHHQHLLVEQNVSQKRRHPLALGSLLSPRRHAVGESSSALLDPATPSTATPGSALRRWVALRTRRSSSRSGATATGAAASSMTLSSLHTKGSTSASALQEFHIDLSKLQLGRVIGAGGNGRIFKARYAGSAVAVKELFSNPALRAAEGLTDGTDVASIEAFYREFAHLRLLKHPHVIQLFGLAVAQSAETGAARYLLVMELAECSLDKVLKRAGPVDPTAGPPSPTKDLLNASLDSTLVLDSTLNTTLGGAQHAHSATDAPSGGPERIRWAVEMAQQVCSGCAFIHDKGLIHFDIKPGNIVIDRGGNAKICDLGIAKPLNEKQVLDMTSEGQRGGTPSYMAPELLRGQTKRVTTKVDVYAFAIVLWQLFHGAAPHPKTWNVAQLFFEVMNNGYRPAINRDITPEPIARLIEMCWAEDPDDRPTFPQISVELEQFQPDEDREVFDDSMVVATYNVGDQVRMWSSVARRLVKGVIVRRRTNNTYDVQLTELDYAQQPPVVGVNGIDLIPANNLGVTMGGSLALSTIPSQQSISDLAGALASRRFRAAQRRGGGGMNANMKRGASGTGKGKGKGGTRVGWSQDHNANLPALTPFSFQFLPPSESGRVDGSVNASVDASALHGGDDSEDPLNPATFSFDGVRLAMQGFTFAEQGIVHVSANVAPTSETSAGSLKTALATNDPVALERNGESWRSVLVKVADLGRGASGVVYSAVHMPSFRVVAVKEIRFADRAARHQCVKELRMLWMNVSRLAHRTSSSTLSIVAEHAKGGDKQGFCQGEPQEDPQQLRPESPGANSSSAESSVAGKSGGPALCPKIVAFYDAYLDSEQQTVSMVLEYMDGGSLQDFLDALVPGSPGLQNERVLAGIARDVLTALEFMHDRHIAHLDIKPANILLNTRGEAKVADFGLARQLEKEGFFHASTFIGTTKFMSPERLRGLPYSYSADIWSLGLTLLAVAMGQYPISLGHAGAGGGAEAAERGGNVYWSLLDRLENEGAPTLPSSTFSPPAIDFVAACLKFSADERPSAHDLLTHPWIVDTAPSSDGGTSATSMSLVVRRRPSEAIEATRDMAKMPLPVDIEASRMALCDVTDAILRRMYASEMYRQIMEEEEPEVALEATCVLVDDAKIEMLALQLGLDADEVRASLERSAITQVPTSLAVVHEGDEELALEDEDEDDEEDTHGAVSSSASSSSDGIGRI